MLSVVFKKLITLVNLKTLIILTREKSPNLSSLLSDFRRFDISSKGMAARRSRKNRPLMYFIAIYLESVTSSPVMKS